MKHPGQLEQALGETAHNTGLTIQSGHAPVTASDADELDGLGWIQAHHLGQSSHCTLWGMQ